MSRSPKTMLYLIRHGATEANLARPPRLQGRFQDPQLAATGVRQAEAARDGLATTHFDVCYSSPLRRAVRTAEILAEPHGLTPQPIEELTECDVGRWEGMDWQTIRYLEPERYADFMADPAVNGYPGGESFADVYQRVSVKIEELLRLHEGETILLVSHHVVNRVYLASLMGMPPGEARKVSLTNCGVSVVTRERGKTCISVLDEQYPLERDRAA